MDRRILITCVVIILIVCLIGSVAAIVGAGLLIFRSSASEVSYLEEVQPLEQAEESPAQDPQGITPPAQSGESLAIDPQVARQMDLIQMQVIQDRGLEPQGEFTRLLISPEQLRQRVLDDFLADYPAEEANQDVVVLAAFGLLEPGYDFYTLYLDLLSEQVAGFYDDDTQEMVVVQGEAFAGPERLTYAHEYAHALQDQNYDLDQGLNFNDETCDADTERCAAIQALLEGDATLVELHWFAESATRQDQEDVFTFYDSYESPVFDSAPEFLTKDFLFPYDQGYLFAQYLFDHGGWGSVDRAYGEPPISTEQILHPEKYPADPPLVVEIPDLLQMLGTGWEELDRNAMGEWYTYLILGYGQDQAARLEDGLAAQAAAGWGGDSYVVYYNAANQSTIMILQTAWDSPAEADEFEQAFREYAQGRFGAPAVTEPDPAWQGQDGYHTLHNDGKRTTWIMAPDAPLAGLIWQAIQP